MTGIPDWALVLAVGSALTSAWMFFAVGRTERSDRFVTYYLTAALIVLLPALIIGFMMSVQIWTMFASAFSGTP